MKPKKEIQISIRIDQSLKDELQLLANKSDRTLADYIRVQLKKIVELEVINVKS